MRGAAELAETDSKAALGAYEKIAADGPVGSAFADLAALRAGAILVDAGNFAEVQNKLEPLTAKDRIFHHTAREFLVLAAWRAGDINLGKSWIDMIMTDLETPSSTRSRVEMLVALSSIPGKS